MPENSSQTITQVHRKDLTVTTGSITKADSEFLTINHAKVRAEERTGNAHVAMLHFQYHGPTKNSIPLPSGAIQHQIGLKILAKDPCNFLNILWVVESSDPDGQELPEMLHIQVKRNPGKKHQHGFWPFRKGCGDQGYTSVAEVTLTDFASASDQKIHVFAAEFNKMEVDICRLLVFIDYQLVWNGTIDPDLLGDIDGPVGLRSDNGRFTFLLFSGGKE